jgi:xanthine dehydrogenase accessory factor
MTLRILVRGGGDLATGAALRCFRAGWKVCVTELPQPLSVRRTVSFSQAIFDGAIQVEEVHAVRVAGGDALVQALEVGQLPVLVDPGADICAQFHPDVMVDGRMAKVAGPMDFAYSCFVIGLGPGFTAGQNCQAVVETLRGPTLGRVYWSGQAAADTGVPERVGAYQLERVLRAPQAGVVQAHARIGAHVATGQALAQVGEAMVVAPFAGVLRGLIQDGVRVAQGTKIGDVDPRDDPALCQMVSDKALAVGGGVLEAVLTWLAVRGAPDGT